jgi:hypothetical protein
MLTWICSRQLKLVVQWTGDWDLLGKNRGIVSNCRLLDPSDVGDNAAGKVCAAYVKLGRQPIHREKRRKPMTAFVTQEVYVVTVT